MSTVTTYTADQLRRYIIERYGEDRPGVLATVNHWLARGDGAAVYENHDFNSRDLGSCRIASFGSERAQLEASEPPARLPDMGGEINWRYVLVGTYRGATL